MKEELKEIEEVALAVEDELAELPHEKPKSESQRSEQGSNSKMPAVEAEVKVEEPVVSDQEPAIK